MKYRVRKLQSGGGLMAASYFLPSQAAPASGYSSAPAKEEETKLADKDLFKDLAGKGLISDVTTAMRQLSELENDPMTYLNPDSRGSLYKKLDLVNKLKVNKEVWDKALANAESSGGLGEVAVASNGGVYVRTDKGINQVTLETYKKNRDKYEALSVAELMMARNQEEDLAFDSSIFSVANQSIGLEKITKHVTDLMGILSDYSSDTDRFYSKDQAKQYLNSFGGKQPTEEEAKSIKLLTEIVNTPGDYAKVSLSEKGKRQNIGKALNYIWNSLGENAQQKLNASSAMNGYPSTKDYLLDMLVSHTEPQTKSSITPVDEATVSGTKGTIHDKPITSFEIDHSGKAGKVMTLWNEPSTGKTYNLVATGVFKLKDLDGKPLGMDSLKNVFSKEVGSLVQSGNAYFGDKKIGLGDMDNIIYDGQEAQRVYMPVKSNGAPDYDRLEEIKALEAEAFSDPNATPEQINEFFKERGLDYIQVNNRKEYIINDRYKPFLMMYGYTGEGAQSTKGNGKIKALSGPEESDVFGELKEIWEKNKTEAPTGWFDWSTTLYKGAIAVPYDPNSSIQAAAIAKNMLAPQTDLTTARIHKETTQQPGKPPIAADPSSIFD